MVTVLLASARTDGSQIPYHIGLKGYFTGNNVVFSENQLSQATRLRIVRYEIKIIEHSLMSYSLVYLF